MNGLKDYNWEHNIYTQARNSVDGKIFISVMNQLSLKGKHTSLSVCLKGLGVFG